MLFYLFGLSSSGLKLAIRGIKATGRADGQSGGVALIVWFTLTTLWASLPDSGIWGSYILWV